MDTNDALLYLCLIVFIGLVHSSQVKRNAYLSNRSRNARYTLETLQVGRNPWSPADYWVIQGLIVAIGVAALSRLVPIAPYL